MPDDEVDALVESWNAEEDEEPPEEEGLYVYPVNSDAVRVFQLCRWKRMALTTMEGTRLLYDSIDAAEINSVADLVSVPASRRKLMLEGVRVMEEIALPLLNNG